MASESCSGGGGGPRTESDPRAPGVGDLVAAREPDARASSNVFEKSLEAADAARTADDAQVQADRHHARRARALRIEAIKSIAAITREILGEDETAVVGEPHVVAVERIGQNHVWPAGDV